jgi:hypothetical protein
MMESAVKTPLISEQNTRKHGVSSKVVGAILTIIGVGIVMLITPSSKMEGIQELSVGETSVGEFAVGLAEMKIGAPVGTQELGSSDAETALNEGMFLPVQIEVNGEEEDASKIFWIGFTDDRKTKFNEEVTFKRHYDGPDCWSKWFNDVNDGKTETKQVDLFMHVPHQPKRLHSIKMMGCIPTKWEAGGKAQKIEVITLTCQSITYNGFKDVNKKKQKKDCSRDADPRDCLSNEDYAKYSKGVVPYIPDSGNGMPEEPKPKFQKCSCKDPESVVVVHVPSPCGCQKNRPRDPLHCPRSGSTGLHAKRALSKGLRSSCRGLRLRTR